MGQFDLLFLNNLGIIWKVSGKEKKERKISIKLVFIVLLYLINLYFVILNKKLKKILYFFFINAYIFADLRKV